ncbi:MAG: YybS family protein, partial [Gemmatimonadetes bacterium]|nr:YybS family protein [Gemmatimonadota bacterium]
MTERGWTLARASLLVVATLLLSPMSPVWFVFVPLALLLLAFRSEDWMSVAVAAVILGLGFAGSRPGGIEWFVPRAWSLIAGGAFVAVSIGRGRNAWLDRSLQAIGVGLAFVLLIGLARPGVLEGVNWWMTGEIRQAAVAAGGILEQLQGSADPEIRRQLEVAVQRWVGFQQDVYPAMLLLATVAALGLAWFGFERLSGRFRSPGPLREFRFSNHLIWLLIGGLCLLVLPLGRVA